MYVYVYVYVHIYIYMYRYMCIYISICICRGIGIGLGIGRGECIGPTKRPLVRDCCFRTIKKTQATPKKKTQVTPKKKTQVTPLPAEPTRESACCVRKAVCSKAAQGCSGGMRHGWGRSRTGCGHKGREERTLHHLSTRLMPPSTRPTK